MSHHDNDSSFLTELSVLLTLVVVSGICYYGVTQLFEKGLKGAEGMGSEEQEYLVESSEKSFKDVKGMDEILSEFEQVVDLLTQGEKYKQIGAKVPKGILLNGKPGTGKTLIAKAIAGEGQFLDSLILAFHEAVSSN